MGNLCADNSKQMKMDTGHCRCTFRVISFPLVGFIMSTFTFYSNLLALHAGTFFRISRQNRQIGRASRFEVRGSQSERQIVGVRVAKTTLK